MTPGLVLGISEKTLFSTFLLTGLRELEVVHLFLTDVSFELQTVRVTAKPESGFYVNT